MSVIENIKMALSSLRAHKMRSILTMLGIIIGVGSVIPFLFNTVSNLLLIPNFLNWFATYYLLLLISSVITIMPILSCFKY